MANCRKGMVKMSEVKMTRKEIYEKIFKMLEIEENRIRNRYEFGEIEYDLFKELTHKRNEEYKEYVVDLALTTDDELSEKMKFIIDANLNTF
jgi:hypothetical protein